MSLFKQIEIYQEIIKLLQKMLLIKQEEENASAGIEIRQKHTTKCYNSPLKEENMIIGHIDLGTEAGTVNEILNGSRSASYHWYIPRHANYVIEFVPKEKSSWGAGVLHEADQSLGKLLGGANELIESGEPNNYAYNICYEGRYTTSSPNEGQIELAVKLMKEKGIDHLRIEPHWKVTSYKPIIVTEFTEGIKKLLNKN